MSDKKNQNHMNPNQGISENKLILIKNPMICLILIGLIGLVIRIYSYPYDLPVYQDVSDYFWYNRHIHHIVFLIMDGQCFFLCFFR